LLIGLDGSFVAESKKRKILPQIDKVPFPFFVKKEYLLMQKRPFLDIEHTA
jgi:hypothetical protein